MPPPTRTNGRARQVRDTDLAGRLRLSVTRLARQLRRQADTGLSPSQFAVLTTIERHGPLTLGALAESEGVAPPTITRVVAKLESSALVERAHDVHDRRVTRVAVTGAGAAVLQRSRQRKDLWLASRLDHLDADQRARLAAAIDVLDDLAGVDPVAKRVASS